MPKNGLERASTRIAGTLRESKKKVFTAGDLTAFLTANRDEWQLPEPLRSARFLELVVDEELLYRAVFESETYRPILRYALPTATPYELGLSLRSRSYLSHGTGVFLHALTDQIQKTIYVNQEQREKGGGGKLSQVGIDRAFAGRQRLSQYVYQHRDHRYVLLSGKQTGNLGVITITGSSEEHLLVANLERTLIDIVVRPAYAGGLFQVLEAYRGAKDKVTVKSLVTILKKLDYTYPYHQAIGFLMERAEYSATSLRQLRSIGMKYDFYVTHAMKQRDYDSRWRVYYPKGM